MDVLQGRRDRADDDDLPAEEACRDLAGVVGEFGGKPVVQVNRGADYRDAIPLNDPTMNGPVPRLPDGHPDLTGPWEGGGSDQDMEADGGLKTGELDALLVPRTRHVPRRPWLPLAPGPT